MTFSPWSMRSGLGAILFGHASRPATRLLGILLLLAGMAVIAGLIAHHHESRQLLAAQRAKLDEAEVRLRRLSHRAAPAPISMSAAESKAHNQAVHHLNTPWTWLLDTFERNNSAEVGITVLEPDGGKGIVRVQVEARSAGALLTYTDALARDRAVAGIDLMRQEINEQDANRPARLDFNVRFAAESWVSNDGP